MKWLKFFVILWLLGGYTVYGQSTIHSTLSGGLWSDSGTWVGNMVPSSIDNVVIDGTVIVDYLTPPYSPAVCNDLTISSSGALYPGNYGGGAGTFVLEVNGNAVNYGNIIPITTDDRLHIRLFGNLTAHQTWSPYKTVLMSSGDQVLTLSPGAYFDYPFEKLLPGGRIVAGSDLRFEDELHLNTATLEMGNYAIRCDFPALIYNGRIRGDFEILGEFSIREDSGSPMTLEGNITVTDTLQSYEYGGGDIVYTVTIEGNLVNNGVIRNISSGDRLAIEITGDILNNGRWEHGYTRFAGGADQSIEQTPGKTFGGDFEDLDSTSAVIAASDLTFSDDFNLQRSHFRLDGYELAIDGWLTNGYLENGSLRNGYLQNLTLIDSLTLWGTVTCDEPNWFTGPVTVMDTLQSNVFGGGDRLYELYIDNNFINNGLIRNINSGDLLALNITGNFLNNGTWVNAVTRLTGAADQTISQSNGRVFGGDFEDMDSTSAVIAASDVAFAGNLNLGGAHLMMNNHEIAIDNWLSNGYLRAARLRNGILQRITSEDSLSIYGVAVIDDFNRFTGSLHVMDTLWNNIYGGGSKTYKLQVEGNIRNDGLIANNDVYGDRLSLEVAGNIENAGGWTSLSTALVFYPAVERTATIFNSGSTNIVITSSDIVGAGAASYAITSGGGPATVPPGGSYSLTVLFTPQSADSNATLLIGSNDIGTLNNITLLGREAITGIDDTPGTDLIPAQFVLQQNYPNPFNPATTIEFILPEAAYTTLQIFNLSGQLVKTLQRGDLPAGSYQVVWNGRNDAGAAVASSLYICRLVSGRQSTARKMFLIR